MGCAGLRRLRMIAIVGFIFSFMTVGLSSVQAQTAQDLYLDGKNALEHHDLITANSKFQSALNLDPNHQGANLFYGIIRILMISKSTAFNTLLDRAGVSSSGRDIFNWTADFKRDPSGKVILPSNSPTGADLQNFLKTTVYPQIDGAVGNLSKVTNAAYQETFRWIVVSGTGSVSSNDPTTLTDSTQNWVPNEWVGFELAVQGIGYQIIGNTQTTITVNGSMPTGTQQYDIFEEVQIDYGDVQVLQGSLYLAEAGTLILTAYDLKIDIDQIVSLLNSGSFNIQTNLLGKYTNLLNLLPNQKLSQAKWLIKQGLPILNSAIDFIMARAGQDNHVFVINNTAKANDYKNLIADLTGSLDGPTLIRKLGYRVDLSKFFDAPKNLRNYLPSFISYNNRIFMVANTFPEPTFGGILPDMTQDALSNLLNKNKIKVIDPLALRWSPVNPSSVSSSWWGLNGVHFSSSTDGWAVGSDWINSKGILLHYSSGIWTSVSPPTVSLNWGVNGVYFNSSSDGWAVGSDQANSSGILLHYSSGIWTSVSPPTVTSSWWGLNGVYFTSPSDGWAVGSGSSGVLLHYSNSTWTFIPPPTVNSSSWGLNGVHFTSSSDGWAVGSDSANGTGVLLHYSSGTWIFVTPPTVNSFWWELDSVHFTSSNDGWALGFDWMNRKGILFHYSNGAWTSVGPIPNVQPAMMGLAGIDFTSSSEGWAVIGSGGLHYSNGSWTFTEFPQLTGSPYLNAICLISSSEGWTVGGDWKTGKGVLLHFSNQETISTPTISGPNAGTTGTTYTYTAAKATSNVGHSVQYLFQWGDGTDSGWLPKGKTSASKSWDSPNNYNVKVGARCATDTYTVSDWSSEIPVNISVPISLTSPSDNTGFGSCSLYSLPTFTWSPSGTFSSYQVQFDLYESFIGSPVKATAGTTQAFTISSSIWKKVLPIPGASGGTVFWRVVGTRADKSVATSNVGSLIIQAPQPVGSPNISPTSKAKLPTLSWNNNCNIKFKVWFGGDPAFVKKYSLSFTIANPATPFSKPLSTAQWTAIRKLVGDISGSTIYWYVESWDGSGRYAKTGVSTFTLG